MSKTKSHKILIVFIGIAAALLVASVAVYLMVLANNKPSADTSSSVATESTPDYGTCTLVSTQKIREAAGGDRITGIQEGVRTATNGLTGAAGEGCVFAFASDKATNNTLTVAAYPYAATNEDFDKEIASARWSEVAGSNPIAYFGRATIDSDKTTLYLYRIPIGGSTILLTLRQNTDTLTYPENDAYDFLGTLGAKLNTESVKAGAEAQAESEAGELPGPPPGDTVNEVLDGSESQPTQQTPQQQQLVTP